ncbi:hypothetical protein NPIL_465841 [Nephila pilipes]|uniref:Uncharacterized protein n=1 Tax=Nephila pilipes TaxID=299642 RepID=A0A8X6PP17_NEPPI|nr:hypothetical protein NPIL_465841 [Nephila pilipes]
MNKARFWRFKILETVEMRWQEKLEDRRLWAAHRSLVNLSTKKKKKQTGRSKKEEEIRTLFHQSRAVTGTISEPPACSSFDGVRERACRLPTPPEERSSQTKAKVNHK